MTEPTTEQGTAVEEFRQISNILAVPTIGNPLPDGRKWKLPCPDKKALADHPAGPLDDEVKHCLAETSSRSAESITGQSAVQTSAHPAPPQTQEPQTSETSIKQTSESGSSKQSGKR